MPAGGGLLAQPWPLAVRARTFDASPLVWVAEVGGLDWMRHPSLYERGGAVDLGPEQRHAWGATSAWVALAAGACALALRSRFERRARVV
ncbi:MAG: hypothetical protein H6828_15415 [Planctomycetes bacterium]|nr:hypothetical protein [Planctomycetota bacterium]